MNTATGKSGQVCHNRQGEDVQEGMKEIESKTEAGTKDAFANGDPVKRKSGIHRWKPGFQGEMNRPRKTAMSDAGDPKESNPGEADPGEDLSRLSRIHTRLSILREAHGSDEEKAMRARLEFVGRYEPALRNYFRGICRTDPQMAEDALSELKVKFLCGKLQGYQPEKGLFRIFLKRCAANLVKDLERRSRRIGYREELRPGSSEDPDVEGLDSFADPSLDMNAMVRAADEALGREFEEKAEELCMMEDRLKPADESQYRFRKEVLRLEAIAASQGIKVSGAQMAQLVSRNLKLSEPLTETNFRTMKSRAERRFWIKFLDEVYDSAVGLVPDLEEIRVSVCEMGYWDRVGEETWDAWVEKTRKEERRR